MPEPAEFVHVLYGDFFEKGVRYFFPDAELVELGQTELPQPGEDATLKLNAHEDGSMAIEWMGTQYHLTLSNGRALSENQIHLLDSIGAVLCARFRSISRGGSRADATRLFSGLPEDRYVSAFLRRAAYIVEESPEAEIDVVADAIEVMRESSLLTYENRRIATGVVLLCPGHSAVQSIPADAIPYNAALVTIKSFHRLCDGLHTVFLVTSDGLLADLVDVRDFAGKHALLPAPSSARYYAHSLATLRNGHICLALTPNGEIKIFAGGVQIFSFLEGRWRLTDFTEKYHDFHTAVGSAPLAERLFSAALNLAEHRRGGLFVVLDDPASAAMLVAPDDLLTASGPEGINKGQIHYLLRQRKILELDISVLQSIARVDGSLVMDRQGNLMAFGAILRNSGRCITPAQEGGRTTAAVFASRFGVVLKVSEDGVVAFYRGGAKIWEL